MTPEFILGLVFTVLVLTYIIGDNVLFRLAVYILIGAGAAYAAVVVIFDVLWPGIQAALARAAARDFGLLIIEVIALLLGVLVWFKASPRLAWIGNVPMGYLIGVGVATVLGGAIIGTLGPQIVATGAPAYTLSGEEVARLSSDALTLHRLVTFVVAVGTIVTLLSFGYFRVGRTNPLQLVNILGRRFFLMIALGAVFALVFMASMTLLIERIYSFFPR